MEGICPMCGNPVIEDTSGGTIYPDFCHQCTDRIAGNLKKTKYQVLEKIERKAKENARGAHA